MMSNPESLPENTTDDALTLNYLNMQKEILEAHVVWPVLTPLSIL
jgi:hypothetical protein